MSTIRALKGAFTSRPSLWARSASHIAFRPHVSSPQPLSCSRTYSVDHSSERSFLQDYFKDQIEKPRNLEKGDRSQQTKKAHSTDGTDFDDRGNEFSGILSPEQEKPKKPWLKKREEKIARYGTAKVEARRSRKTARNIALLEQEIRRRHAAGRPDITSAIDPERSEITPRTAQEAIARWQEMKEKDSQFQPKESRAVRALKRDIRREAKEARIFMASQAAERTGEQESEQKKLEQLKALMVQRKNAECSGDETPVKTRHASNDKKKFQSLENLSEPVAEEVSITPQQKSPVSRNARAVIKEGQADVSNHVFQALDKLGKTSSAQPRNTTKLPREVPAQAQQNAVQTPEEPQENHSPEETAESPNEWEDEMDDEAEWDGREELSGIERRRMKLLLRFKEGLQKKMGIPVGDTKPHPQIDAKCEAWLHKRIKAEKEREKRKKVRMAREHQKFLNKLARKAKKNAK